MRALPAGRHFFRGSDGYEAARRGTVWHRRVPDRYPEVIVQAVSADDIVSAIRYATVNGHKVSVVSGGHSFAASHLRDGAVLLDVSRIDHASIDADKGRAVVGPGKGGSVLMAELEAQGLFFPGGHCRGVCLGGYLLQGGYGWNSRIYGPACESVIGLDVITADGAQIHCDADNHADLYWAARGAGPGFFGVVTSFYLKLYPRPATCGTSVYVYPFDLADEVFTWARAVSAEVDPRVELQALASRGEPSMGIDVPVISLASPAFADSPEEAEQALALFGTCPVVEQALVKVPYMPTDLPAWYDVAMTHYLSDHHYAVDNMWTSASAEDLLPGIRSILDTLPPHPAHFLWLNWVHALPVKTWPIASKPTSTWRSTAPGRIRPTRRSTPTGRGPTWPRCRIWRSASSSPTRTSVRVRRASPATRPWPSSTGCAPNTTPTVCSTVGWEESDGQRSVPGLPQRRRGHAVRQVLQTRDGPAATACRGGVAAWPQAGMALLAFDDAASIVDEGYQQTENGYGILGDGSMQVSVRTDMPGVTPAMWAWWFGWHGSDTRRYKLWHPRAHLSARWKDGDQDSGAGRRGAQRYVGRWSMISEYIGSTKLGAAIQFVEPAAMGLPDDSDDTVSICARLGSADAPVDAAGSSIRSDRRRAGPRCGHGFGWADRTSRCARHPRSRPRRCVPSRRS